MPATTFAQLPREIRDMIWAEAAAIQLQWVRFQPNLFIAANVRVLLTILHIADGDPKSPSPLAERQRQSLVGYDHLPYHKDRDPLRVFVYGSSKKDQLRIGVNEFQLLVNSLSIATVCTMARSCALQTCRAEVQTMSIFYGLDTGENCSLEPLQHSLFTQPTTVMITNAIHISPPQGRHDQPPGFESAEQIVDIVSRAFGQCVTRIHLNPRYHSQWQSLERIYWPHSEKTRRMQYERSTVVYGAEHDYNSKTNQPPEIAFMAADRVLHIQDTWNRRFPYEVDLACWHLCKFHELLDVSKEKLPRLREIGLAHYPDGDCLARIRATEKDGALWICWEDFGASFDFGFDD